MYIIGFDLFLFPVIVLVYLSLKLVEIVKKRLESKVNDNQNKNCYS